MKNRISELRKLRNMNQTELAEVVGATLRQISYCESGNGLSLESACKIADFFNCSLDYLAYRDFSVTPVKRDPTKESLLQNYDAMNAKGRALLAEQADTMASSGKYEKRGAAQVPSAS